MEESVCLFFISTAHSGYPGVPESFHVAVCVCSCCHLIRHTNVCHCPGSPRNHVLLHPEVLPSCITVRAWVSIVLTIEIFSSMHDCIAGLQCSLNSVPSKPWPCLEVKQIHYSENMSFYKSFCSSSSRTSGGMSRVFVHDQSFLKTTGSCPP